MLLIPEFCARNPFTNHSNENPKTLLSRSGARFNDIFHLIFFIFTLRNFVNFLSSKTFKKIGGKCAVVKEA